MTASTRNRLAIALLASGVALAIVPLSQALADPTPPAAPEVPVAPHIEKRVIIVQHGGGKPGDVAIISEDLAGADEDALQTRVIQRDGKTIVIRTSGPVDDPEIERQIAELEAMPRPPEPAAPPPPGMAGNRIEKRIIVRGGDRDLGVEKMEGESEGQLVTDVDSAGEADGKRRRVHIRICADEHETPAEALAAVRRARDDVAANPEIPEAMKADILGKLDSEIARLQGGAG